MENKFKVGDRVKDSRRKQEGIITDIDKHGYIDVQFKDYGCSYNADGAWTLDKTTFKLEKINASTSTEKFKVGDQVQKVGTNKIGYVIGVNFTDEEGDEYTQPIIVKFKHKTFSYSVDGSSCNDSSWIEKTELQRKRDNLWDMYVEKQQLVTELSANYADLKNQFDVLQLEYDVVSERLKEMENSKTTMSSNYQLFKNKLQTAESNVERINTVLITGNPNLDDYMLTDLTEQTAIVGAEVYSAENGFGKITSIDVTEPFPVEVTFDDKYYIVRFTFTGYYFQNNSRLTRNIKLVTRINTVLKTEEPNPIPMEYDFIPLTEEVIVIGTRVYSEQYGYGSIVDYFPARVFPVKVAFDNFKYHIWYNLRGLNKENKKIQVAVPKINTVLKTEEPTPIPMEYDFIPLTKENAAVNVRVYAEYYGYGVIDGVFTDSDEPVRVTFDAFPEKWGYYTFKGKFFNDLENYKPKNIRLAVPKINTVLETTTQTFNVDDDVWCKKYGRGTIIEQSPTSRLFKVKFGEGWNVDYQGCNTYNEDGLLIEPISLTDEEIIQTTLHKLGHFDILEANEGDKVYSEKYGFGILVCDDEVWSITFYHPYANKRSWLEADCRIKKILI
jgi:hypothetical protein